MSQALDELKATMQELGIEPKKALGQNFLVSDHVIQKIIEAARNTGAKSIIEIGPGPGALTRSLVRMTDDFKVIELDSKLAEYWRGQNLTVIEADALRVDWRTLLSTRPCVLVSNLPYQISSSLVIDRSLDAEPLDAMVLMFQKEVAQKIKAGLDHSTYGMLSVVSQTFWKIETLLEASPRDFLPAPKVASRVLVFEKKETPIKDRAKYLKFIKGAFLHPRKLMISNLIHAVGKQKEELLTAMKSLGIDEKARAEQLTLQQFVDFYFVLGYK